MATAALPERTCGRSLIARTRPAGSLFSVLPGASEGVSEEIVKCVGLHHLAHVFGGLVGWLSSILGPTAGGYLSAPEKSLPWLFSEGSFFSVHAYLLPCVVSASVNVFGFLMGLCYLHETHPNPRHLFECWRRVPSTGGASTVRHVQLTETHSDTESVGSSGAVEHGPVPAGDRDSPATTAAEVKAAKETDSSGNCVPPVLRPQETQIPQQSSGGVKHVRHRVPAGKRFWQSRSEPDYAEVSEVVTPHTLVKASLTDPRFVTPRSKSSTAVLWELLHTPAVLPILVANSNLAFTVICLQVRCFARAPTFSARPFDLCFFFSRVTVFMCRSYFLCGLPVPLKMGAWRLSRETLVSAMWACRWLLAHLTTPSPLCLMMPRHNFGVFWRCADFVLHHTAPSGGA